MENPTKASIVMFVTILLTVTLFCSFSSTSESVVSQSADSASIDQEATVLVVINEFMANNKTTIQSPSGNYSDWIELFNPANNSVDLGGMFLTDNLTDLKWQFSTEAVIKAHGYLLVWADGNIRQGPLHARFKLDAKQGAIALYATDGITLIDSVTYGRQIQGVSFGRTVDGGSSWNYLLNPTPGKANAEITALFTGYPWQLWAILSLAFVACTFVVFKFKIYVRRNEW
jgi:hypothetical protein